MASTGMLIVLEAFDEEPAQCDGACALWALGPGHGGSLGTAQEVGL
jgi:hypothetical protein